MITLLFRAKARFPKFSVHDLDIMRVALRKNHLNGITGYLLRDGNTYLQVVEGNEDDVQNLVDVISADSRIFGFHILCVQPISEREYPGWSMGYYDRPTTKGEYTPIDLMLMNDTSCKTVQPALEEMRHLGAQQFLKERSIQQKQPSAGTLGC